MEHFLLWLQAAIDRPFFGEPVPTSIVQLAFPRVELHLFYNVAVFLPMLVAMYYHMAPPAKELSEPARCTCRFGSAHS
ncbi:MAG: hypothetical protein ACYC2O_02515 [Microthrixaceae bacterium]